MHTLESKQSSANFENIWDCLTKASELEKWQGESRDLILQFPGETHLDVCRGFRPNLGGYLLESFVRPRTLAQIDTFNAFEECLEEHRLSFIKDERALTDLTPLFLISLRPGTGASRIATGVDCEHATKINGDTNWTSDFVKPEIIFKENYVCNPRHSKVPCPTPVVRGPEVPSEPTSRLHLVESWKNLVFTFKTYVDLGREVHNVAHNPEPIDFGTALRLQTPLEDASTVEQPEAPRTQIMRYRYHRPNLKEEMESHEFASDWVNIGIERNFNFDAQHPYEPEYVRFQRHPETTQPLNHTRHGLCAYCPTIHFYHFKTLAYGQHLALFHGIYPSNYVAPDPLYGGIYNLRKLNTLNTGRKRIAHYSPRPGVVCPACYEILECDCTKTTKMDERPLTKYLRHFRDCHVKSQRGNTPYETFKVLETEPQVTDTLDEEND